MCVGDFSYVQVCGSCTFHFVMLKLKKKKCIARINGIVHSLINPHAFEFAYLTAYFMTFLFV